MTKAEREQFLEAKGQWLDEQSEKKLKKRLARILLSIKATETGCWEDGKRPNPKGYRLVNYPWTPRRLHVVVWEHFIGPVPEGKDLHHNCENKLCCNPAHLEPLTDAEHLRRHRAEKWKKKREKETCSRGHLLKGDNFRWRNNRGVRLKVCRECERRRSAEYRQRSKGRSMNNVCEQ